MLCKMTFWKTWFNICLKTQIKKMFYNWYSEIINVYSENWYERESVVGSQSIGPCGKITFRFLLAFIKSLRQANFPLMDFRKLSIDAFYIAHFICRISNGPSHSIETHTVWVIRIIHYGYYTRGPKCTRNPYWYWSVRKNWTGPITDQRSGYFSPREYVAFSYSRILNPA